jgi:hypothetical protein
VGTASEASCAARDELRSAITDLSNVDVVKNVTSAITGAVNRIKDDLSAVRSTAGEDVRPQVDAFQQALVSGLRDVASTGATLVQSLQNLQCP